MRAQRRRDRIGERMEGPERRRSQAHSRPMEHALVPVRRLARPVLVAVGATLRDVSPASSALARAGSYSHAHRYPPPHSYSHPHPHPHPHQPRRPTVQDAALSSVSLVPEAASHPRSPSSLSSPSYYSDHSDLAERHPNRKSTAPFRPSPHRPASRVDIGSHRK